MNVSSIRSPANEAKLHKEACQGELLRGVRGAWMVQKFRPYLEMNPRRVYEP